uniref:DUF4283 domain-containing protein n=1 Tax=Cannabis sativa TaxID=3483 RepID=A0A803NLT7_CANSA
MNRGSSSFPACSHQLSAHFHTVKPMPSSRSLDHGGSDSSSTETQNSSTHLSHASRPPQQIPNHSSRIIIYSGLLPNPSSRTVLNETLTCIDFPLQFSLFTVKSLQRKWFFIEQFRYTFGLPIKFQPENCTFKGIWGNGNPLKSVDRKDLIPFAIFSSNTSFILVCKCVLSIANFKSSVQHLFSLLNAIEVTVTALFCPSAVSVYLFKVMFRRSFSLCDVAINTFPFIQSISNFWFLYVISRLYLYPALIPFCLTFHFWGPYRLSSLCSVLVSPHIIFQSYSVCLGVFFSTRNTRLLCKCYTLVSLLSITCVNPGSLSWYCLGFIFSAVVIPASPLLSSSSIYPCNPSVNYSLNHLPSTTSTKHLCYLTLIRSLLTLQTQICFFLLLVCYCTFSVYSMDDLTNSLSVALNLTETECTIQTLHDHTPTNTPKTETQHVPLFLVVKVHTVKSFNRKNFIEKMTKNWNHISRSPVVITERPHGLFLVEFGCDGDRRRVLLQQPWTYLNQAILMDIPNSLDVLNGDSLLKIPLWVQVFNTPFLKRSEELAALVSSSLGHMLELYKPSLRETWGPYFRLRVHV